MLVSYQRYLGSLPRDRQPDVVVITGDLTATGKSQDLRAVATTLRICFSSWAGQLRERVFIVPGPRDISWENSTSIGLQAFYEIFADFGLPYHTPMPSGQDTPAGGQKNFIGYAIDTCYSPDELQDNLTSKYARYARVYRRFVNQRGKVNTRWMGLWKRHWRPRREDRERLRAKELARLRQQFLELTESGQLVDLSAGRITQADMDRFEHWVQSTTQNPKPGAGQAGPFKILITHHPFAIRAEHDRSTGDTIISQDLFRQLVKSARLAGFHLALHGHVHNPQLLTDLSLFVGPDHPQPIRQMGAASLGKTGVFNEITAVVRDENDKSSWRMDLRLINVKADGSADIDALSLLNPAETAHKQIRHLTHAATQRRDFERAMHAAMRRFSEQVYQAQGETQRERSNISPLPQAAMLLLQDVIRDVIFKGYETRVQLFLKSKQDYSDIPKFVPTYLAPAVMEGPDELVYPASVAAWALILGRTLKYPEIKSQVTEGADHEWLRRTAKFEPLLAALKSLMQEGAARSYPGKDALDRYQTLYTTIEAIRGATSEANEAKIAGKYIYQLAPSGSPAQSYPHFICVPYPRRPGGGAPPALPETAVLDVGVRRVELPDGQGTTPDSATADPFTSERVEMLETLMELIGLMLTTSSALGKPRGVWDDRGRI